MLPTFNLKLNNPSITNIKFVRFSIKTTHKQTEKKNLEKSKILKVNVPIY